MLGTKYLDKQLDEVEDIYSFLLAREVGRIRMGHTRWIQELLLTYVLKIPVLRAPLRRARVYSAERYGAYLTPNGVRGLIALASGRPMLKRMQIGEYLRQVHEPDTRWTRIGNMLRDTPLIAHRVRARTRRDFLTRNSISTDSLLQPRPRGCRPPRKLRS